ncbi:hypothetical protein PsYK624_018970 [Phanerochaete sordida]|uniref:Uncharacterized protein n=1 Tax=Phanerochaete sordida TaxID=48140 RepID=A0A9P3FYY6_9APHY|nr:hypothetical protein PsYK624_018970 [Phanerochaete sordida]
MVPANIPDLSRFQTAYFALFIAGGHVGVPALIILFTLSKQVHRPASVINFCITWVIYSVAYSLLMYTGKHGDEYPPFGLCLAQAAMVHGAPPMAAVAGLGVVLQAYSTFQLPWQHRQTVRLSKVPRWLLLLLTVAPPYLVFAGFAAATAVAGLRRREVVKAETRLYCSLERGTGQLEDFSGPIFCTVLLAIIVALEVAMIIQYWHGWLRVKQVFPLANRKPSLSPWLRVSLFTLYSLATLLACISFLTPYASPLPYMIQAALPVVATLLFASQSDIYHTATSWMRRPRSEDDVPYTPGGGWSTTESTRGSTQLTGHLTLSSEA